MWEGKGVLTGRWMDGWLDGWTDWLIKSLIGLMARWEADSQFKMIGAREQESTIEVGTSN